MTTDDEFDTPAPANIDELLDPEKLEMDLAEHLKRERPDLEWKLNAKLLSFAVEGWDERGRATITVVEKETGEAVYDCQVHWSVLTRDTT